MLTDPIADMFTRLRNAYQINQCEVKLAHSKVKEAIAMILVEEGYIESIKKIQHNQKKDLLIKLKYFDNIPAIKHLKRISKPGLRVYSNYQDIPRPLHGMGLILVSTPQGIISGKKARLVHLGGELIGEIY